MCSKREECLRGINGNVSFTVIFFFYLNIHRIFWSHLVHCGWSLKSHYLTLLYHLQLGVSSCLFRAGFPPNGVSVSLLPITCHYARPSCPPWLNYKKAHLFRSRDHEAPRSCSLLHPPVNALLLGPNCFPYCNPSNWSQLPRGLRRGWPPLTWRDCGFETRRGHGCLSVVSVK